MDEAGESPENMEALKTAVMEKLSEWYMRNHGVGTMANVEDMCTLLQVKVRLNICLVKTKYFGEHFPFYCQQASPYDMPCSFFFYCFVVLPTPSFTTPIG